jgi:geranylgeranyl pyrophosphate synthase
MRADHAATDRAVAPGTVLDAPDALDADITERLDSLTVRVDAQLRRLFPTHPDEELADLLVGADAHWSALPAEARRHLTARVHGGMVAPLRRLIDLGGRRWRPGLVLHAIDVLGGDAERLGPLVAAMEVTHAGSLVVDDVEDEAPVRRGRPTAHMRFGTATAVNAGTASYFTLNRALSACLPDDHVLRGRVLGCYLTALMAAHTGQGLDIQSHTREMDDALATGDNRLLLACIRQTHRLKSGAVEGAFLEIAAMACAATPRTQEALGAFGTEMGTAYQISDDVADLRGVRRAGTPTKAIGEDLCNGKVTMPLAHAVALLPPDRIRALWHRVRDGGERPDTVHRAVAELERCGALEACAREARQTLERTWCQLRPLLPPSPDADVLYRITRHVIERNLA